MSPKQKKPAPPKTAKKETVIYIRLMERRDIPTVVKWLSGEDYRVATLADYDTINPAELKNQLLKELALPKFIFASTQLMVAEANGELLVGFISLRNIDWRSRHASLNLYIPKEFRATEVPLIVTTQVYGYVFRELNMHKVSTAVLDTNEQRLQTYKTHKKEPEVILEDYLFDGKEFHDLHIFATFKREVVKG
jgi:RimJ/RimL family protein N-acetyltransferase